MVNSGVVCRGSWDGREVIGIRLNWHKRYITLAPVATVLGLAFKLYDPDHLIGNRDEIGITVALVPTSLPGVEIGRRHLPALLGFQNGPTRGRDVFIPIDHVIGGIDQVGEGWKMLMSALAAGRGISLPSLSAAASAAVAHATGAYARIREQFNVPIGRFEAVQERLGRMAATAYLLDAARRLTCAVIDRGHKPAVITAIMKAQATERMRVVANDAMDIHGGKGVQEGPLNYLGTLYRGVPIGITVEGANIMTRALIQFGQGAIRSHPYMLAEMTALEDTDRKRGTRSLRPRLVGACRAQPGQCVARLDARLDRWHICAVTGDRRRPPVLQAARALRLRVRVRRRCCVAHAWRPAQAPGDDIGPLRRHSLRALPALRCAQALAR